MKIDQNHYRPWQLLCLEWNANPFLGWCFAGLKSCQCKHKHWAAGNVSWHCSMALAWKPNCFQGEIWGRSFASPQIKKNLISLRYLTHFAALLLPLHLGRVFELLLWWRLQLKLIQSVFWCIKILNITLNVLIIYNWANSRDWTKTSRDRHKKDQTEKTFRSLHLIDTDASALEFK